MRVLALYPWVWGLRGPFLKRGLGDIGPCKGHIGDTLGYPSYLRGTTQDPMTSGGQAECKRISRGQLEYVGLNNNSQYHVEAYSRYLIL